MHNDIDYKNYVGYPVDVNKLDHRKPQRQEIMNRINIAERLRMVGLGDWDDTDTEKREIKTKYFKSYDEFDSARIDFEAALMTNKPVDDQLEKKLQLEYKYLRETNQI